MAGLLFVTLAAFGFANVLGVREALTHMAGLMATYMMGSVFLMIIPNRRMVFAALLGKRGVLTAWALAGRGENPSAIRPSR